MYTDLTPQRLTTTAEEIVRSKLQQRPRIPLVLATETGGAGQPHASLDAQAKHLAALIGVDPDCLRPDDRLGQILRVDQVELPEDVRPLLPKFGLHDHVLVGGMQILDYVERRMGQDRSIVNRAPFVPSPQSEDEWMDRIMNMTVGELLTALA